MEEFVYYPHTIYPVVPGDGKFTWTDTRADLDSNGKHNTYYARLFVKDYHNIRGIRDDEVASSRTLTIRRVGAEI